MCAALLIAHCSLLISTSAAQGLPLIRNFTAEEYDAHNRNFDIEIGEDGTVFVGNFEGLLYYDRAQWHILHTPDLSRITVVFRDSKNNIWVGGYKFFARVKKLANGTLALDPIGKKDLFKGEVMEIFESDANQQHARNGKRGSTSGTIQFVASDNNIYEVKGNDVVHKQRTKTNFHIGVESDIVSVEALQKGGSNVLMTDITQTEQLDDGLQVKVKKNSGLIIADSTGRELYTITEENGLCSNLVSYVAYDGHGTLWGATLHGIFAIELPSVYSYVLAKDGLAGEVHAIMDFDGKIYVGTSNGLFAISGRQCQRIQEVNNICWLLCKSKEGLLTPTSSGIYKIAHGGGVKRMTSNATTAMLVDGDKIYAGEPDGVYLYQSGDINTDHRTKVNDLPLVTSIRKNERTGLWFKNVHGETVGTEPEHIKEPTENMARQILLPISDIRIDAQYQHNGMVWIGGDEVLAVIDTKAAQRKLSKKDVPTIRFRSIILGSDSVLWGGFGKMPSTLPRLDVDDRHLHFTFATAYKPMTGKTLYRYRLNDNKWTPWSEKQDVEFLNLPYGNYTLTIQAKMPDGQLTKETAVKFSIAYPLLMRWYMVILYLVALILILYALFQYRLKRLEKDKLKLERIVEERTADLRNAQSELVRQEKMASVGKLTEGLIDRILNPMNYIINFSKMSNDLLKDLKDNIENNKDNMDEDDYLDTTDVIDMLTDNLKNVDQYGQNTTRTLKAMEEMLKDRTGGYVDMDLLPVLNQIQEMTTNYYAKDIEQYGIQTRFTLPEGPLMMHGNPDMLTKTIMSLIGNAVYAVVKKSQRTQYTPEVTMTTTVKDGNYVLVIHDNGIGIEEKILDKVFDPFFTTKTTDEAAGVGLYLSREIIQNHGGDITVSSVKDEYTEFTITIPSKTQS